MEIAFASKFQRKCAVMVNFSVSVMSYRNPQFLEAPQFAPAIIPLQQYCLFHFRRQTVVPQSIPSAKMLGTEPNLY